MTESDHVQAGIYGNFDTTDVHFLYKHMLLPLIRTASMRQF